MHPLADLLICLRFFTRLPVPATRREADLGAGGFAAAAALVPLAGAIVGLVPALAVVVGAAIGLPPLLAAALGIAALVLVTGALHEDALADCADGFGGGRTRDEKLAIMRDSRIGAFGTCAIILSLLIRVVSLGAIVAHRPWLAAASVVVAASLSRTTCLLPLRLLPPARADGLGAAAGRPTGLTFLVAIGIAIGLGLLLLPLDVKPSRLAATFGLSIAAADMVSIFARRQIGGQTGDVVGAAQQAAECAALSMLAAAG